MGKMWMIEVGEYSDYRVYGPFTTKEKAEDYFKVTNSREPLEDEIVEREVDPEFEGRPYGFYYYLVHMKENGDTLQVRSLSPTNPPVLQEGATEYLSHVKDENGNNVTEWVGTGTGRYLRTLTEFVPVMWYVMWAADEKHAVKIANERRIAHLAAGTWRT